MNLNPIDNVRPKAKIEPIRDKPINDSQKDLENFFRAIDGVKLENSDGKTITLTIEEEHTTQNKELVSRVLEFQGYLGEHRNGNYIVFTVNYDTRSILINRARLTDKDLRGKNIYAQVIKLVGEKFPDDFTLEAVIGNPKEHRNAVKLFKDFEEERIDENTLKQSLFEMIRLLQLRRDAGFNTFTIAHTTKNEVSVKSTKNSSQTNAPISITVQPLPKTPHAKKN